MTHLEEIRAKLSIEELVSGYVQLKKAGRNLRGLCPFHNDTRPSFMVSPEKGIAYCFSCNNGGDIFKFIQLIERVEFPEAVRILAERTGVRLPEYKPEQQDEKQRLLKANEAAVQFFAEQLKISPVASHYFENRGLTTQAIETFRLGFAPDSYKSLKEYSLQKGFSEKELLTAGLLNQRSIADQNTYDRFRNRVIFPIADHQGNWVGFGGRILDQGEPKYLNSPDTPIYNKSYVLYGLNMAKEAIKQENLAIFVEGYMDVIACHQAGTKNVIATSGTALTAGQLKLIKRYTHSVAFAFDQDSAGMEATKRAIELAREAELEPKIILIPNGKDPDECIKESKEIWLKAIKEAIPAMDFYFAHALKLHDKSTLEGKKAIAHFLLPLIQAYPTRLEQDEYLKRLAFELQTEPQYLWEDMKRLSKSGSRASYEKFENNEEAYHLPLTAYRSFGREEFLLAFIVNYPQLYPMVEANLMDLFPTDSMIEKIYNRLKKVYASGSLMDASFLKAELSEEESHDLDILALLIEEHYPEINEEKAQQEMLSLIKSINQKNLKKAQKDIEFKIRSTQNIEERNSLLNQYNEMIKLNKL